MQKQVEFYRDILNLDIIFPHVDDYTNEFWVQFNTGECSLCLHGGGQGDFGKDAPRFTFEIKDIHSTREKLRTKGIECTDIREAAPNTYVCDFTDPEGNVIALEQFPSDH